MTLLRYEPLSVVTTMMVFSYIPLALSASVTLWMPGGLKGNQDKVFYYPTCHVTWGQRPPTRPFTFVNGRDHSGKDATVHVFDAGVVATPVILWCLARPVHALVSQVEEKRLGSVVLVHDIDGARRENVGAIVALHLIERMTGEATMNPKGRHIGQPQERGKVASGKQRDVPAKTKAALCKMGHNWAEVRRGSQSLP